MGVRVHGCAPLELLGHKPQFMVQPSGLLGLTRGQEGAVVQPLTPCPNLHFLWTPSNVLIERLL
jgi:hypothetical protein